MGIGKRKSVACPRCGTRVVDRRIGRKMRKHTLRIKCSCGFYIEVKERSERNAITKTM